MNSDDFKRFLSGDATKTKEGSKLTRRAQKTINKAVGPTRRYMILANDPDSHLLELINYIRQNGAGGHSFGIDVDPDDTENKRSFFFDGDGSDRIEAVTVIPNKADPIGMFASVLHQIRRASDKDLQDDIEKANPGRILEQINHVCDTILCGVNHDTFDSFRAFVKTILGFAQTKETTMSESELLKHIAWICNKQLEDMDSALTEKEAQDNV